MTIIYKRDFGDYQEEWVQEFKASMDELKVSIKEMLLDFRESMNELKDDLKEIFDSEEFSEDGGSFFTIR